MSQDDADKPTSSPPNDAEDATSAPPPAEDQGSEATKDDEAASGADEADETDAPNTEAETTEAEPPKEPTLEDQLAASQEAAAKMKEKMLRVAADFENFRRRSSREVDEARQRGTQTAVKDLLPVFDNLERATAHVDDTTDVQSMVKGLEMVHKQFLDVLGKMGIERVASIGEGFDPNVHESIQYEHSDEHDAGVVMNELQPGYRMGRQLLRPALVVVSRGPAPQEDSSESDEKATTDDAESTDESTDDSKDGAAADDAESSGNAAPAED